MVHYTAFPRAGDGDRAKHTHQHSPRSTSWGTAACACTGLDTASCMSACEAVRIRPGTCESTRIEPPRSAGKLCSRQSLGFLRVPNRRYFKQSIVRSISVTLGLYVVSASAGRSVLQGKGSYLNWPRSVCKQFT